MNKSPIQNLELINLNSQIVFNKYKDVLQLWVIDNYIILIPCEDETP